LIKAVIASFQLQDKFHNQNAIPLEENHLQEKAIARWWDTK